MGLLNILRDISYWDSKDWKIGGNFPQKTWPLCGRKGIQNPFDPSQSPSSCWHWNIQGTWCMCVCVPFNDFCVVFFGDSQWEKDHDSTFALSSVVLQRSHPMAVLVELQSPEITSHIKVHWSATANCWMPWDMPSARWRTWRAHYCKAWGEWKPTKPLDYGCLKFSISSCEPKWLLQILECFA
jgi:hypothetical protein